MFKWLHHLFNPHCTVCASENRCKSCDLLATALEQERYRVKQLTDHIFELNTPKEVIAEREPPDKKPVQTIKTPWHLRKQMLEHEDRLLAKTLKDQKLKEQQAQKTTEQLEKELGVANG